MQARMPPRVEDGEEDEACTSNEGAKDGQARQSALPTAHVGDETITRSQSVIPPCSITACSPPGMSQPSLNGKREKECDASDAAADDEERLEERRPDVGYVRYATLLRDIFRFALD